MASRSHRPTRAVLTAVSVLAFTCAAAPAAHAQMTLTAASMTHQTFISGDPDSITNNWVLDGVTPPNVFSTFDGQTGVTLTMNEAGTSLRILLQGTAPDANSPAVRGTGVGGSIGFTLAPGAFLRVTPDPANTIGVNGILGVQGMSPDISGYFGETGNIDALPTLLPYTPLTGSGPCLIYFSMGAFADSSGNGGLRTLGAQIDVVPEPATLATLSAPFILGAQRRRRPPVG